jgi:subtilisin family serine protease
VLTETCGAVLATARAFVTDATPLAAKFVEYEMPADFLTDLAADIAAFEHAIAADVGVINNSWGYTRPVRAPAPLAAVIRRAQTEPRGGKGALVVFAAGNDDRALRDDELTGLDGNGHFLALLLLLAAGIGRGFRSGSCSRGGGGLAGRVCTTTALLGNGIRLDGHESSRDEEQAETAEAEDTSATEADPEEAAESAAGGRLAA